MRASRSSSRLRPGLRLVACTLVAAGLGATAALVLAAEPVASGAEVFHFPELDRRYQQLATQMAPWQEGGLTVALSSPENELELLGHRLVLTPRADGSHDVELTLDFAGSGTLIAALDLAGAPSRFEDRLTVPRQSRTIPARVRLAAVPEGYSITTLMLPVAFPVVIESRLGSQLVAACLPLAALGLAPVSCDDLHRAFSLVRLPLPEPGETYLFTAERFSPQSRQRLDRYLALSSGAATGAGKEPGR